ncbi:MAG: TerB family tellurite resistance protein [Bacteroidia bacterium]|nr:TerB family tellurite resistance protein [Bacteroidia bacterium]
MAGWSKWLWGGLGWAVGGPIGGIIGFALGAVTQGLDDENTPVKANAAGDFGASLLVLCAVIMKADNRLLKSELDFIRQFFNKQFGETYTQQRMLLLREILKQDIDHKQVCLQIKGHLNYASRLELMHLLFGVAAADNHLDKTELDTLSQLAYELGIKQPDFISLQAMFVVDKTAAYKILEIDETATDDEVKKAYRKMAVKYHPDKVHHLGPDFQKDANIKFQKITEAYESIKKQRGF